MTFLWRHGLSEAFGTFVLVFAGTGAIVANDISGGAVTHVGIALTFGLVVFALIEALGEVSGAHINPAVTLGLAVAGRFPWAAVVPYILCQLMGAVAASLTLYGLFPEHVTLGATLPRGSAMQSFVFEFILTLILMFVILAVTLKRQPHPVIGLTIGAVVGLEALFAGPICGASMNPARSIGPALVSGQWQHLWLYIVAPVAGAVSAVGLTVLSYGTLSPPPAKEVS